MALLKTQSKGELARENIIKAAQAAIATSSYEEASLNEIAKMAGTTQTNVLYHFKNKKGLLGEVISAVLIHGRAYIDSPFDPHLDAYEKLKEYINRQIEWASKFREDASVITYLYYLSTRENEYKVIYQKIQIDAQKKILEHLLAGKREKLFKYKVSDEVMSAHLHDHLLGSILNFVTTADPNEKPTKLKNKWNDLLHVFLNT